MNVNVMSDGWVMTLRLFMLEQLALATCIRRLYFDALMTTDNSLEQHIVSSVT